MMRMRSAAALAAAVLITLAGCSKAGGGASSSGLLDESAGAQPAAAGKQNAWTHAGVLRWTSGEDIATLNPALNTQGVMLHLSELTMAWLIRWDHSNNAVPELLTVVPSQKNGGVSKDGLTITYHLRKGVKWSDGQPFDADDVVFSFKAVLNPQNNVTSRTGWDRITKIDEPDKYTVVLHLSKPYSPFIDTFFSTAGSNPAVMPKHILGNLPNINTAPYNSLPVGIGPFKYSKWERGQRVVMVANPYYFRGTPKLKEIDYEIIPDSNTVLTEIQAHQLDMWYPTPGSIFKTKLQGMNGFGFIKQAGYLFNHIDFNTKRPAMQDVAVRRALRLATDRVALINKVGHGIGILQEQPAPKVAPYYDPAIQQAPFDTAQANKLLDDAGWKRGADGIRAKNGVRLDLDFVTNSGNPTGDQIIEMLRDMWKNIGVSLNVRHYDSARLFDSYQNHGTLFSGNYDVAFFAWGVGASGDFSALYACDQQPPNGQNILHWCNPRADKAMHDLYNHYDQADRNKDDAVLFEELDKDVPTIVENGREDIFYFNSDLRNFHPNAVTPFDDVMNVDMAG